jgi:hypothetical protein
VKFGGVDELHAAFLNESRTRGCIEGSEVGNPGSLGMTNLAFVVIPVKVVTGPPFVIPSAAEGSAVALSLQPPLASALFGVFDPDDSGSEEDAGDGKGQQGMRPVTEMDCHSCVNPPHHGAHEPDKGKISHSHRGYLSNTRSQCDNPAAFRYFGNDLETILKRFPVRFFPGFGA